MTGFASLRAIRDALAADRVLSANFAAIGPASSATPAWQSGWYTQTITPPTGGDPAAASGTPGAGGTAYSNDPGGIIFPDVSTEKFLIDFTCRHDIAANLAVKLVDRLVGVGSIAITTTGDKNVNSVALPRYTSGEGIEVYFEVQTAGTTTIPVVSLASYTNQDGTGGKVGAAGVTFHSATAVKGSIQGPLPLAAGDTGVRSVETINVATAGGGSCAINVLLVKTICWNGSQSPTARHLPSTRKSPLPYAHMQRIYDGATLQWMRQGSSSGTSVEGTVRVVVR